MKDKFIQKLVEYITENNIPTEKLAQIFGIDADSARLYLKENAVPPYKFIEDVSHKLNIESLDKETLESIFVQGDFGTKIPLLSGDDFVYDNVKNIVAYYELPHLGNYMGNTLFALRYTGKSIERKGILHDSVLVFEDCTGINRDGIYAVVKRGHLSIKEAKLTPRGIEITPLDSVKRIPSVQKTAVASGRLVCCINNF